MKEALRLALEALQNPWKAGPDGVADAIIAIKEALAQPEQEPVAWMFQHNETGRMSYVSNDGLHNPTTFIEMNPRYALVCPLYTTPPQRTWVGLTDEEIDIAWRSVDHTIPYAQFRIDVAKAIEAKLRSKNENR